MGSEGREGDWECGGCRNRNYAFRLICNRCKQSRLLVDTKTPADSKWLPRIGDWICAGCSNNNYASREKCKKCGQAKEVAAMPAIAMPGLGASLPTYAHYFARAHGAVGLKMNLGMAGNSALQQSLSQTLNWSLGGHDKYGLQSAPGWLLGGNSSMGFSFANNANQLIVPKGWRTGDWICNCGFHNYSSRLQCKKCNASGPSCTPSIVSTAGYGEALKEALSALSRITCTQHVEVSVRNQGLRRVDIAALNLAHGTKRLAPDEFVSDWDNKRLNAGVMNNMSNHFLTRASNNDQTPGAFGPCPNGSSGMTSNSDVQPQLSQFAAVPALIGKGAKQWRDGDWMCKNCNNHNFASRSHCNRCKTQKDAVIQPVSVA